MELLFRKGASIGALNNDNETPLHSAVVCRNRNSDTRAVELLLERGASIEAKGKGKNTPLHLAIQFGHTRKVELLLKKGASIEAMDEDNNTPLHLAALSSSGAVKLLLEKGASIEAVNKDNNTPLQLIKNALVIEAEMMDKYGPRLNGQGEKRAFIGLMRT